MKKKSMEQIVYKELRKVILNKKLSPGSQLVENVISQKLNVSRTPIRSALKKLSSEGLVEIIPNKGAFVIQPSYEEIKQAYDMRIELEGIAIKNAWENINKYDLEILKELTEKEQSAFKARDIDKYLEANREFHMLIINKSNNKFLIEFAKNMINQTNVYLIFYDVFYEITLDEVRGVMEHKSIIEALSKGGSKLAEEAMKKHIGNSFQGLEFNKIAFSSSLEDTF